MTEPAPAFPTSDDYVIDCTRCAYYTTRFVTSVCPSCGARMNIREPTTLEIMERSLVDKG